MPDLAAVLRTHRRSVLLAEAVLIVALAAAIWLARGGQPGPATPAIPVEVVMTEMGYEPARIVARGPDVTLLLRNAGSLEHDFSIDALRLTPNLRPCGSETVAFTAEPGTYEVYCSIRGHRQAGMVAELVVEP